jgi:hypothetical protein
MLDQVIILSGPGGRVEAATQRAALHRKPVACIWMDVDLECSAPDALGLFDMLDSRLSCICLPLANASATLTLPFLK